jgi:hypothetical protein
MLLAMRRVADYEDTSVSEYIRRLVTADLRKRGIDPRQQDRQEARP